jgi:acyl carrier protein
MTQIIPPVSTSFPGAAVEACLRTELIETIKAEASIKDILLPTETLEIAKMPFEVDSLIVVSILCAVESIVGFELPNTVVRAGGYVSVESALQCLLPQVEEQWIKWKGVKP